MEVEKNVSQLTIRNYHHYLQRFVDWLTRAQITDLQRVDGEAIRQYRVYLAQMTKDNGEAMLSKKTQSYHVIALRSWLKWLVRNDVAVLHPEKIDIPKGESQHMKYLTVEQVEALMEQPVLSSPAGLRDRAILEVLFSTGLRVSELTSLNRSQVNTKTREFGVIGKGRRPRVVFLSERAAHWLDRWLVTRDDDWLPVFVRFSQEQADLREDGSEMRLTPRSVQRMVAKYCRQAKLPIHISPHGMRHSFATDLLKNGAGLRDVQELLGHKNISTTQIYTHVTSPQLKSVHDRFHAKNTTQNASKDSNSDQMDVE
jgi:site-specific recombinase XerD